MEGKVKMINNIVNELKGELAEAYKTIAEKEELLQQRETEVQRLRVELVGLKKRSGGDEDGREPKGKPSPGRKADEIIPKECWGMVFQNLSAKDLLSCREVCKTFNQVLDAKEFKQQWKFKLILPLLFPYLKTSNPDRNHWENLSSARLACRSWRHWIDKYASEVHGTSFFPNFKVPLTTFFQTVEEIKEFQQKFPNSNTNPFPSRTVYIANRYHAVRKRDETLYAFCWIVGEMLEQFGKHIFRLELWYPFISRSDRLTLCKLLKRITFQLPNLKELYIHDEPRKELDGEVASYIAENALAVLPKLRALKMDGLDKKVEDYLLDAFGPQLTQLETTCPENLGHFQMQQLNNMQKLWLELRKPSDTLEVLRFLESPLKLLKLSYSEASTGRLLDIRLRYWDQGRVNLAAGIDIEEYENASIKTLIIIIHNLEANADIADGQISFNFLQALTKLENLELKFSGPLLRTTHPGEVPEVVKLNEYLLGEDGTDLPYHSNVWEKVPSLRTITSGYVEVENEDEFVSKSIYTREKYESIIVEEDGPERK